jgi:hypothetical protein
MCTLREGKMVESQEKKTQNEATKPNCTRVRVAGLGKELRMVFEEVLVKALDKYQMKQRIYGSVSKTCTVDGEGRRTTNLGETGALSASEISWMLALTLPFLVRIVLKASPKLFCLECPRPPVAQDELGGPLSLRGCQRSLDGARRYSLCGLGSVLLKFCVAERSMSGNFSIDVRTAIFVSLGNL